MPRRGIPTTYQVELVIRHPDYVEYDARPISKNGYFWDGRITLYAGLQDPIEVLPNRG